MSRRASSSSSTCPASARRPSRSHGSPVMRCAAASSRQLAGPVSKASTDSPRTTVTLAMPPRFSAACGGPPPSHSASRVEASGAPSPPAAMSRARRSDTTGSPVASTTHAGWPSCKVPRARPSTTRWRTVWRCEVTRSPRPFANPASAATAASAVACPTAWSRSQISTAVVGAGGSSASRRARRSSGHGCSRAPSGRIVITPSARVRSATATSRASMEVPESRPATITTASVRPTPNDVNKLLDKH